MSEVWEHLDRIAKQHAVLSSDHAKLRHEFAALSEKFRPAAENLLEVGPAFEVTPETPNHAMDIPWTGVENWTIKTNFELPDTPPPPDWLPLWIAAVNRDRPVFRRSFYLPVRNNTIVWRIRWSKGAEEGARSAHPFRGAAGLYALRVELTLGELRGKSRVVVVGPESFDMELAWKVTDLIAIPGMEGVDPTKARFRIIRGHELGSTREAPYLGVRYGEIKVEGARA